MKNKIKKFCLFESGLLSVFFLTFVFTGCTAGHQPSKKESDPLEEVTGQKEEATTQEESQTQKSHSTEHTNALVNETSPYLLMHAHNLSLIHI